jgi:acyl-CoA thioester hydrolase
MAAHEIVVDIPVAWGDMDSFAHVNNAVYLRWFETARILAFESAGLVDRMKTEGVGPILARAVVDYRRPVVYPDTVRIACWVGSVGRTSFVLRYRAHSAAQNAVVAEGETVVVMLNYRSGAKVPIEGPLRARLELHLEPPPPPAG